MSDKGTLRITLLDAAGQPAADPATDLSIVRISDGRTLAGNIGLTFPNVFDIPLPSFPVAQGLICWLTPKRYRTCHSNIFTLTDGQVLAQSPVVLRAPPQWNARFTRWADLSNAFNPLRSVLAASHNVVVKETKQPLGLFAGDRYDSNVDALPTRLAKSALLNLYAKMDKIAVPASAASWFGFVQDILMIGRERFVGLVQAAMWDSVKKIHDSIDRFPGFVLADVSLHLHNLPPPYGNQIAEMISVKSKEDHGNLQLTMARCIDPATGVVSFLLDVDIDEDRNFFLHARDLFTHIFSGGTHPFDVHEILIYTYGPISLGYELV